jgi:hypothetical protein
MGSSTFENLGGGKTPEVAFAKLIKGAKYFHGHGGGSGTIAEKSRFIMIELPADVQKSMKGKIEDKVKIVREYSNKLIQARDIRIDDKWGPAGCIQVSPTKFFFFGWAAD